MSWPSPLERFENNYMPEPNSGCWLWTAALRGRPLYGTFRVDGKQVRAHRWAYEHFVGPIPEGLVIDHLCRVPSCVNPDHLEPVTNKENLMRGQNPPAQNARKTQCSKGHPLTEQMREKSTGRRICRICLSRRERFRRLRLNETQD